MPERNEASWQGADQRLQRGWEHLSLRWSLRRTSLERRVALVTQQRDAMSGRSDLELTQLAHDLRRRLRLEGLQEEPVACAFALVRELAGRLLGTSHRDVQLMAGWVMLAGGLAEMQTGEGKTLAAVLPACVAALAGIPVHVVTANDYLVTRDAKQLGPIYEALGLSATAATADSQEPTARRAVYRHDVVYITNKQLISDYLRDQVLLGSEGRGLSLQIERLWRDDPRIDRLMLRGLRFAIVDEADSLLIDEARTPVILSRTLEIDPDTRARFDETLEWARGFEAETDFRVRHRQVELTRQGEAKLQGLESKAQDGSLHLRYRRELVLQALSALHAFERDRDYLVRDGKVEIIDLHTGRVMADRSWERGLHQMVEIKEGCSVTGQRETIARISYQRFFRRYLKLAGMTGTASEVSRELWRVYGLHVVRIPTMRPSRRIQLPRHIYPNGDLRWEAVRDHVRSLHEAGRPVLVGTSSVAASEKISSILDAAGLFHVVLNARQDRDEAEVVARAGDPGRITVATGMAGRGTDIRVSEAVVELGGLHVIVTELGEARRIDRQLRGRCARQGDPGSTQDLLSWDDPLTEGPIRGAMLATVRRLAGGHVFKGRMASALMLWLQLAAELRHAKVRRAVLRADGRIATALAFTGARD